MIDRPLDGLGASDAAAILGVSRWRSALDVFNEKVGITKPGPKEEHQEWGLLLEDAIAARYQSETGRRVRKVGTARSAEHPILYSHPDRLVVGERGLVEIKVSESKWDEIPIYYKTQAIQQLITTGREWVDFAVLVRGQRFLKPIPRYMRDRAIEPDFIAELEEWWARHIVAGEPPDMDGAEGGRRYLLAKYGRPEVPEVIATAAMLPQIERYQMAYMNRVQAEQAEERAKQEVMRLIGDATILSGPFGKIKWTRFTQHKTDWKAVTSDLERYIREHVPEDVGREKDLAFIRSMHTNEVAASRLTPSWKEKDD